MSIKEYEYLCGLIYNSTRQLEISDQEGNPILGAERRLEFLINSLKNVTEAAHSLCDVLGTPRAVDVNGVNVASNVLERLGEAIGDQSTVSQMAQTNINWRPVIPSEMPGDGDVCVVTLYQKHVQSSDKAGRGLLMIMTAKMEYVFDGFGRGYPSHWRVWGLNTDHSKTLIKLNGSYQIPLEWTRSWVPLQEMA